MRHILSRRTIGGRRRRRRIARLAAAVIISAAIALIIAIAPHGSSTESGAVHLGTLDPGSYPTVPRAVSTPTDADAAVQESIRLGEFVTLLSDVDPRLAYGGGGKAVTPQYPPDSLAYPYPDQTAARAAGLIAGWTTGATHRPNDAIGLQIQLTVLRFGTADQAARAGNLMADNASNLPGQPRANRAPLAVPGYSGARSVLTAFDTVDSWLPQGELLVGVHAEDDIAEPDGPAPLLDLTRRVLDKQLELLPGYPPTPADQIATAPSDIAGMLGRTLPNGSGGATMGVYAAHAALTGDGYPVASALAFRDAGVDLMARDLTTVYRTADQAAARRLQTALSGERAAQYEPIAPPPGLPVATCGHLRDKTAAAAQYYCSVPYGRYLAEVPAEQPRDLQQRADAQYELLTSGG